MDHDQDAMRDRVSILERKVLEQNDEIIFLRTTLVDVLRRLNQMETSRSQLNRIAFNLSLIIRCWLIDYLLTNESAGHFGFGGSTAVKKEATGRGRSGASPASAVSVSGRRSTVNLSATSLIGGDSSAGSNGGSPEASPAPHQLGIYFFSEKILSFLRF